MTYVQNWLTIEIYVGLEFAGCNNVKGNKVTNGTWYHWYRSPWYRSPMKGAVMTYPDVQIRPLADCRFFLQVLFLVHTSISAIRICAAVVLSSSFSSIRPFWLATSISILYSFSIYDSTELGAKCCESAIYCHRTMSSSVIVTFVSLLSLFHYSRSCYSSRFTVDQACWSS